jgi:hypothetical protein
MTDQSAHQFHSPVPLSLVDIGLVLTYDSFSSFEYSEPVVCIFLRRSRVYMYVSDVQKQQHLLSAA